MSGPKRIQRKRTKGWRMPEGAVYVGRPTRWGNPFVVGPAVYYSVPAGRGAAVNRSRVDAVRHFTDWLSGRIFDAEVREYDNGGRPAPRSVPPPPTRGAIRAALTGRDLACWCPPDQPCHADVLLEIANQPAAREALDRGEGVGM